MDKESKDNSIEIFRMKKLFKRLEKAKVSGSVVTIVIPPKKTSLLNDQNFSGLDGQGCQHKG